MKTMSVSDENHQRFRGLVESTGLQAGRLLELALDAFEATHKERFDFEPEQKPADAPVGGQVDARA